MNITFTKLGNEECEKYEEFDQHNVLHSQDNLCSTCSICNSWSQHKKKSNNALSLYRNHCENSIEELDTAFYSADLQKVIILPWMPSFKVLMFTRRIVAFNESFIPLHSISGSTRPLAVVWGEPVAGRKKDDLVSTFYHFFLHCVEKKKKNESFFG